MFKSLQALAVSSKINVEFQWLRDPRESPFESDMWKNVAKVMEVKARNLTRAGVSEGDT